MQAPEAQDNLDRTDGRQVGVGEFPVTGIRGRPRRRERAAPATRGGDVCLLARGVFTASFERPVGTRASGRWTGTRLSSHAGHQGGPPGEPACPRRSLQKIAGSSQAP